MRSHAALGLAALLSYATATAASVPGVVSFDFDYIHAPGAKVSSRVPVKAIGEHEITIYNEEFYYAINITLGTPPQPVQVLLDTGSSDLWVMGAGNPYCYSTGINNATYNSTNEFDCQSLGIFTPNASSTWTYINSDFYIEYGDYSFAKGLFGNETVTIADGTSVTDVGISVATISNSSTGVMGIGYAANEATNFLETDPYEYANFPIRLYESGYTKSRSYSLYLEQPTASGGIILFGGVDSAKYTGGLWTVPLINLYPQYFSEPMEFTVGCEEIQLQTGPCPDDVTTLFSNNTIVALLDSGTSYTYLPDSIASEILTFLGATYNDEAGYVVPCSKTESFKDDYLVYYFSGVPIKVSLANIFFPLYYNDGTPFDVDGEPQCQPGLSGSGTGVSGRVNAIFGDSFLRAAYVVYDLDKYEVSLGQAVYTEDSDIEVIVSSVPGAKAASLYSPTTTLACSSTSTSSSTSSTSSTTTTTTTTPFVIANSTTTTSSSTLISSTLISSTLISSTSISSTSISSTPSPSTVVVTKSGTTTEVESLTSTVPCPECTAATSTDLETITDTVPCSESTMETAAVETGATSTLFETFTDTVPCSESTTSKAVEAVETGATSTLFETFTDTVPCSESTTNKAVEAIETGVISTKLETFTDTVPCSESSVGVVSTSPAYASSVQGTTTTTEVLTLIKTIKPTSAVVTSVESAAEVATPAVSTEASNGASRASGSIAALALVGLVYLI